MQVTNVHILQQKAFQCRATREHVVESVLRDGDLVHTELLEVRKIQRLRRQVGEFAAAEAGDCECWREAERRRWHRRRGRQVLVGAVAEAELLQIGE